MMKTLVLATTNPGKTDEFRRLLGRSLDPSQVMLATPDELGLNNDPIDETGHTFAENARLKAIALAEITGLPALADDSGLCVDALDGAPGLYSARWAGETATDADRIALLLQEVQKASPAPRTARFVCAAALAVPQGDVQVEEGVCEGIIADSSRGENGFGYDPIFLVTSKGRTMAELTDEEKDEISHRAVAIARLGSALRQVFCRE